MTVTSHTTESVTTTRSESTAGLDPAIERMLGAEVPRRPDHRMLVAYASWLYRERERICRELYPHLGAKASTFVISENSGFDYHGRDRAAASTRAEAVLTLVGCDWSDDAYLGIGDTDSPAPDSPAFPDPDARLIDLERNYLEIKAAADEAGRVDASADAEFRRREEPFAEADRPLLKGTTRNEYWSGHQIRQILAGRVEASSREDALIDAIPKAEFERLLPLAEARDARREAMARELTLAVIEQAAEVTQRASDKCAELVYRMPARTFAGLALKARVLRADRPELWNKPSALAKGPKADWHEIALTEIADSVEHLLANGRATIGTPSLSAAPCVPAPGLTDGEILADPAAVASELAAMTFDPVDHRGPCPIPSRDEWIAEADGIVTWLRIAWLMLTMPKDDLVSHLDDQTAEHYQELVEALRRSQDNFGNLQRVAATAMSRMLIATAVSSVRPAAVGGTEA